MVAQHIKSIGEIVIIEGFSRLQLDGFAEEFESLFRWPDLTVPAGQVVVSIRILRIQFERLFPLHLGTGLVLPVVKEASVGQASANIARMALKKIGVSFVDWLQALTDSALQIGLPRDGVSRRKALILLTPLCHLSLSGLILRQQLLVFLFNGRIGS